MPCFSCKCFHEGRGRNGEFLSGGRGWCELRDQEYYRGHECRDYAPTWHGDSNHGSSLKEPGGCFLTSACVQYKGLADDCLELTELRQFRDTVLGATAEGRALVNEYYCIAPPIVEHIEQLENKGSIYESIYQTIQRCIALIRQKEYDQAVELYRNMVYNLRENIGNSSCGAV